MHGFELKRLVEFLWKNPTTLEEKTPINQKNKLFDSGSIAMERSLSTDDVFRNTNAGKKYIDDSIESRKEDVPQKMSLLRKLCFFLSLNGGFMYVLVMAWLLPCRMAPCLMSEGSWTANLSHAEVSTNMEVSFTNSPGVVIFGSFDQSYGRLNALRITDGKQMWNATLPAKPLRVVCYNKESGSNVKRAPDCFVTADNFVAAFNPKNGDIIWERDISTDQIISKVTVTPKIGNQTYSVVVSDEYMYLLDTRNGTEVSKSSLPCSWTTDVKIAGPWLTKRGFIWALVCEYRDGMKVWTFEEREFLRFSGNAAKGNLKNGVKFKPLFSQQSYSGSIDLVCDVTTTPNSLVLSWADMVVMVTAQAPFHHLHKNWERRFSSSLGYAVDVTSLATGHFISSKSIQIAVAVQEGSNATIHILEIKNSTSLIETELGAKRVISIKKIETAGKKDALLIETTSAASSSNTNLAKSQPTLNSYFAMQYKNDGKSILQHITDKEGVYASSLSSLSEGKSNLLLASKSQEGDSYINRFVIKMSDSEKSWCSDERNRSTSAPILPK